jgi:hypothetical protein
MHWTEPSEKMTFRPPLWTGSRSYIQMALSAVFLSLHGTTS